MNIFETIAHAGSDTAVAQQGSGAAALLTSVLPFVVIIVLFYFMLIKPQRKKEKETRAMIDALKVGDKVVTIGGICGKVAKIKDNYIFIETGNIGTESAKSILKLERAAIRSVDKKISN